MGLTLQPHSQNWCLVGALLWSPLQLFCNAKAGSELAKGALVVTGCGMLGHTLTSNGACLLEPLVTSICDQSA